MVSKLVALSFGLLGLVILGAVVAGGLEIGFGAAHLGGGAVGATLVGLSVARLRQKGPRLTPDQRLFAWLREHERQVLEGTALYKDVRINPETRLLRYHCALSAVVMSVRSPSRLYVEGAERTGLVHAAFSLATLLFGWWGIPWGPIYSVQSLAGNFTQRDAVRVGELLDAFAAEEEPKPEPAP
jgi:hypothetical protein